MKFSGSAARTRSRTGVLALAIGLLLGSLFSAASAHAETEDPSVAPQETVVTESVAIETDPLAAADPRALRGGYCSKVAVYWDGGGLVFDVPADASFSIECRLDQGANSIAVKALQKGLNGHCAVSAGLAVDGQFGAATRNALIAAQKKFGVTPDGIYGPNTAHAFKWTRSDGACRQV